MQTFKDGSVFVQGFGREHFKSLAHYDRALAAASRRQRDREAKRCLADLARLAEEALARPEHRRTEAEKELVWLYTAVDLTP